MIGHRRIELKSTRRRMQCIFKDIKKDLTAMAQKHNARKQNAEIIDAICYTFVSFTQQVK